MKRITTIPVLPPRKADAHKGNFGRVLIVAGSKGMCGAAVLCGSAALRSGAGLVTVASPPDAQPIVAAGTIPKVVIAYAGTYSAGRAADFYYRFGKKPSAEQLSAFTKQASEIAKQLPFLAKGEASSANGAHDDQPTMPIDAQSTTKLDKPS